MLPKRSKTTRTASYQARRVTPQLPKPPSDVSKPFQNCRLGPIASADLVGKIVICARDKSFARLLALCLLDADSSTVCGSVPRYSFFVCQSVCWDPPSLAEIKAEMRSVPRKAIFRYLPPGGGDYQVSYGWILRDDLYIPSPLMVGVRLQHLQQVRGRGAANLPAGPLCAVTNCDHREVLPISVEIAVDRYAKFQRSEAL